MRASRRKTRIVAALACRLPRFSFGLGKLMIGATEMEKAFVDDEDGGSEEQRNRARAIVSGTRLFQITALARSSPSGFVKRLDGIDLRGVPKRNRR